MTGASPSPYPPAPLWSILIATLASRQAMLADLLAVLMPQCLWMHMEVLGCYDNGENPLPAKRAALLDAARGTYVSYVDDDDMVEADFVAAVMKVIFAGLHMTEAEAKLTGQAKRPDFIAFDHAYYADGVFSATVRTGLDLVNWPETQGVLIRPVTHINPVRRALTHDVNWWAGPHEDWSYVTQITPRLNTQVRIGRVLYHYRHRTHDTVQRILAPHNGAPRLDVDSPCFRWIEVP